MMPRDCAPKAVLIFLGVVALGCLLCSCAQTSLTKTGLRVQGDAALVRYRGPLGSLEIHDLNHSKTNAITGQNIANGAKAIGAAVATSGVLTVIK